MKKFSTMLSCLCLALFGAIVGLNNKSPAVTATAAPVFADLPLDLRLPQMKYDTVYITRDSIIPCKKNHYKPKVKEVRIPYAVRDTLYVPVVTTIILRDRVESSQDSTMNTIMPDSIQVQKTIGTPDSVCVHPVNYLESQSLRVSLARRTGLISLSNLQNSFYSVQAQITWWENMLACSTGEKLKRYHERYIV